MVGNIDYIIDIVAEKRGVDRELVRILTYSFYKEWKKRMTHTTGTCIDIPAFGKFIVMNAKLRRYIREQIHKLRKVRKKIESKRNVVPNDYEKEKYYVYTIKITWEQIEHIRKIYIRRNENRKLYKALALNSQECPTDSGSYDESGEDEI
jgi:hypothetical protein